MHLAVSNPPGMRRCNPRLKLLCEPGISARVEAARRRCVRKFRSLRAPEFAVNKWQYSLFAVTACEAGKTASKQQKNREFKLPVFRYRWTYTFQREPDRLLFRNPESRIARDAATENPGA